jgi:xanthine dehydrogenase accessory factor
MSHAFARDAEHLAAVARTEEAPGYVGVLGPRGRTARLLAALGPAGPLLEPALHAPAGLDIGAETPDEIALAILAEVKAVLAGRSGGPLRQRRGALHEEPACEPADARLRTGSRSA